MNPSPEEWGTFGWSVAVGEGLTIIGEYDAVYIFEELLKHQLNL